MAQEKRALPLGRDAASQDTEGLGPTTAENYAKQLGKDQGLSVSFPVPFETVFTAGLPYLFKALSIPRTSGTPMLEWQDKNTLRSQIPTVPPLLIGGHPSDKAGFLVHVLMWHLHKRDKRTLMKIDLPALKS